MPTTTLAPEPPLVYIPMSRAEFDIAAANSENKMEWVDGVAIVMNTASFRHNVAFARLTLDILQALPELEGAPDTGLEMPDRLRRPDLMVVDHWPEGANVIDPPLVVVEVLSGSTWKQDLIAKAEEYAKFGIGQYWVVDPEFPWMSIRQNVNGAWETLFDLNLDEPTADVEIPGYGVVPIDLRSLIRPKK